MSANGGCAGHTQAAHGNGYARKANGIESSGKSCAVINDASTAGPDGKLSWVIAITCFVVNLIGSCFFRCTGMFFSYVMDTFNAARGEASVPLSLYGGFYNMAGIVAGALMESFGVRCTFILGGLMMTVGFSVSLFATSTLFLVFTVGVLAGVGHGMVTSCCIVAVTRYFDKRRGIALGLNLAGPPMASLLVPKLLEWLLSEFGLRGTFLVLGGCMANIPVLGILLRKPPWEKSVGEGVNDTVEDPCCEAVKSGALPFNRSNAHLCDRISLKGSPMEGGCGRRSTKTSVPNFSVRFSDRKTIPTIIPTGTASKETGSSVNVEHRFFLQSAAAGVRAAFFHRVPAEYAYRKRWAIESTTFFDRSDGFAEERSNGEKGNDDERGRIVAGLQKSIADRKGRTVPKSNIDKLNWLLHF